MKKIVLLAVMGLVMNTLKAQSIDDVREILGKKDVDYAKAKETIDKHLAIPKNAAKPDGWYYKGFIYNAISKRDNLKSLCTNCKMEAFEAFKKYQELDKKNVLMALEQNASLFDLYNGLYDAGATAYNEKNFKAAFDNFSGALLVEDYVKQKGFDYNGYKYPALDTALVLNTALSARFDKNEDASMTYYKILSDANVAGPQYLEMYEFIAAHYKDKKDTEKFSAALAQGRKLYPEEAYWTALEMESIGEGATTKDEVFVKYDEMIQRNPGDYTMVYNYAVELYNYIYAGDGVPADKKEGYKQKLAEALKKSIAIKSNGDANLLMARYLYNSAYDFSDDAKKIKGAKPADVKMRKELNDKYLAQMNEAIPYCETANKYFMALPTLKPIDKANYKQSLGMLQNIYLIKKDAAKADAYGKLLSDMQ
ncbi:hypothetical protein LK994_09680 [Ferruginibacter lapsinanis]|uniref:hypothetical protein n=1 Tax=Ferruginibacter lapsinanis TaxID=563172 RepID=UPI001E294AB3|nr:hypothetical protein [Ferruginibacter lapsinanis]UEG48907.1 hypothetical protein LK994_09680 [Ferruginibacter lapsinanis]